MEPDEPPRSDSVLFWAFALMFLMLFLLAVGTTLWMADNFGEPAAPPTHSHHHG